MRHASTSKIQVKGKSRLLPEFLLDGDYRRSRVVYQSSSFKQVCVILFQLRRVVTQFEEARLLSSAPTFLARDSTHANQASGVGEMVPGFPRRDKKLTSPSAAHHQSFISQIRIQTVSTISCRNRIHSGDRLTHP